MKNDLPIIIGITGASGVIYGRAFLREMIEQQVPVHLIMTDSAMTVWSAELGVGGNPDKQGMADWLGIEGAPEQSVRYHHNDDIASICASGTFRLRGMAIVPCSMNTLGALAHGISNNLLTRSADVCLKEKRPLIVCPRETPLTLIHLKNMTTLAQAGATIVPAMPGFYHKPETIDDLVELFVMKLCDLFELPCSFHHRWRQRKETSESASFEASQPPSRLSQ